MINRPQKTSLLVIGTSLVVISSLLGLFSVIEISVLVSYLSVLFTFSLIIYTCKKRQNFAATFWVPLALFFVVMINKFVIHLDFSNPIVEKVLLASVCLFPTFSVILTPKEPKQFMNAFRILAFFPASIGLLLSVGFVLMPLSLTVETFDRGTSRYDLKFEDSGFSSMSNRISLYKVKTILPGIEFRELEDSVFSEYGNIKYKFKDSNTLTITTDEHGTYFVDSQEMKIPND